MAEIVTSAFNDCFPCKPKMWNMILSKCCTHFTTMRVFSDELGSVFTQERAVNVRKRGAACFTAIFATFHYISKGKKIENLFIGSFNLGKLIILP